LKFDFRISSYQVDLEEGVTPEELRYLPRSVNIGNPAYDITPLKPVTGIVTEEGLFRPQEIANLF